MRNARYFCGYESELFSKRLPEINLRPVQSVPPNSAYVSTGVDDVVTGFSLQGTSSPRASVDGALIRDR